MRLLCKKSPIEVTPMIIEVQSGRQNYQLVIQLWALWAPFGFLFAQNGIPLLKKGARTTIGTRSRRFNLNPTSLRSGIERSP